MATLAPNLKTHFTMVYQHIQAFSYNVPMSTLIDMFLLNLKAYVQNVFLQSPDP